MKIRVVKTASKASAVQAIRYQGCKRVVVKHFGSCHTDKELHELLLIAKEWIKNFEGQIPMFPEEEANTLLPLNHCSFLGVYYTFFYDLIGFVQQEIGFNDLDQPILNDLITIRLFEPASKLRSIELLENYFGIIHQRKNYYKTAHKWILLKNLVETKVIDFAKKKYSFNFDLLFYDVTTLYFETFEEDELRKNGFSKDNKSQQPQIVIAWMVSQEGFPITYEVFPGNTFEGHTILPVVKEFIDKHSVKSFTVVADAAMISASNIEELLRHNIHYIVGARLGNLPAELMEQINTNNVSFV